MDSKIHIHFFPRDATRVRVITFSRPLGLTLLFITLPLCLLGFWMVLSGVLHESPDRKLERRRLEHDNRSLHERTIALQHEANALENTLDTLESTRLRALLATGLETQEPRRSETRSLRFRFFHSRGSDPGPAIKHLAWDLKQAQTASLFFDSSLFVLTRNKSLVEHFPTAFPVGRGALVIRPFGPSPDPFTGRRSLHAGVDFSLRTGAPVYASGGGRVVAAGNNPLWGNFVRIRHTERVETFYAHLQDISVHAGEEVPRGKIIGTIGQSGSATGPHLHFEMLFLDEHVDPLRYLYKADENATL